MPSVLTTASRIACPSQGTISPVGQPKLKVAGAQVVRLDGISNQTVSGCSVVTNSNTGEVQCKMVASASGAASKLKVSGSAVALETLSGMTNGNPLNTLSATANQTKLKAS